MTRLHAMHLARRLPAGSLAEAAFAGLQDSAPRAGLLSLHARMEGVGPTSWEHDGLVQVWGPRLAAWLIPQDAIAAFTLGRLPRDLGEQRRLQRIADEALNGAPDPYRRAGAATGRFLIRWDARTTRLVPIDPPDADPEEARVDLARRFLTWFGDEMRPRFAHWAGIEEADATETLGKLGPIALTAGPPPAGVRFLPLFDPYTFGRQVAPAHAGELTGTLLVRGEPAGTWARQARRLTVHPDASRDLGLIEEEANRMAGPLGGPITLRIT